MQEQVHANEIHSFVIVFIHHKNFFAQNKSENAAQKQVWS